MFDFPGEGNQLLFNVLAFRPNKLFSIPSQYVEMDLERTWF